MKLKEAQRIVREASPAYLAQNPPTGTMAILADMTRKFAPAEFRKPFVRRPDENDDQLDCDACLGDGECWITEEQDYVDCPYCGGSGHVPYNYNQVFIFVYRNFHSVEALATVSPDSDCHAVVTVSGSDYEAGQEIELTEEEKNLARSAVKEAS